jgi:hypothetical protein
MSLACPAGFGSGGVWGFRNANRAAIIVVGPRIGLAE